METPQIKLNNLELNNCISITDTHKQNCLILVVNKIKSVIFKIFKSIKNFFQNLFTPREHQHTHQSCMPPEPSEVIEVFSGSKSFYRESSPTLYTPFLKSFSVPLKKGRIKNSNFSLISRLLIDNESLTILKNLSFLPNRAYLFMLLKILEGVGVSNSDLIICMNYMRNLSKSNLSEDTNLLTEGRLIRIEENKIIEKSNKIFKIIFMLNICCWLTYPDQLNLFLGSC